MLKFIRESLRRFLMRKTDLPAVITSMKEIPLGPIIERLTTEFDTSQNVRLRVIRNTFAISAYALSLEQTQDIIGGRTNLCEFAGPVWHRETQIGYFDFLGLLITKLSGQQVEPVATEEDCKRILKIEAATELWQINISFRLAVDKLRKAIVGAIKWFDMQLMNIWLDKARYVRPNFDEKLEDIEIPYCGSIFQNETFGQQHILIDHHCYFMGGQIINSVVSRLYENLMATDAPQSLKDLFLVTQDDLAKFAIARRGYDPDIIDERKSKRKKQDPKPETKIEPDQDGETPSAWKKTEGGIIIPKTTRL